ncbi:hypothetical protein NDU88_001250 [Pleurodeles waltl]|uniref:Uncharacterized protein n=1 Tax=Pleurodeles waltl TaxID=8319 RepID=A0AAV7SYQ3_PLEWA|nr:hypothetical protein NDU88_001250 [Pleurodeles waltl]
MCDERDERDETLETLVLVMLVPGGSHRGLLTASASASARCAASGAAHGLGAAAASRCPVDYGVVWTLSKPEGAPEEYRSPRAREEY